MKITKSYPIICPSCQGSKKVRNLQYHFAPGDVLFVDCLACGGTGIVTCTETTESDYTSKDELNDEMRCSEEMNENKTE